MRSPCPNSASLPRVLVVEDEPRLRDVLAASIAQMDHTSDAVRSGEEALEQLERQAYDIVLLDLNLPMMSGMECFESIRRRWPETQVVILTGFGDLESARQAIRLNVVEFLTKPASLGELEQALHRAWIRRRGAAPPALPPVEALPADPASAAEGGPRTLRELERAHILSALERHGGNREAAAAELGISVRTLYYRLAEYQREPTAPSGPRPA